MKLYLIFIFVLLFCRASNAQINIALLHQLVAESKSEHALQSQARDGQAASLMSEELNRSSMNSLKNTYRKVRSRFSVISEAVGTLQTGLEAAPLIEEIYAGESILISICGRDPLLLPVALMAQVDLADRAQMLLRFVYGIVLSAGDLSQMTQSDRRLLISHIICELREISGAIRGLCRVTGALKESRSAGKNPFSRFIDRDRETAERILQRFQALKNQP